MKQLLCETTIAVHVEQLKYIISFIHPCGQSMSLHFWDIQECV